MIPNNYCQFQHHGVGFFFPFLFYKGDNSTSMVTRSFHQLFQLTSETTNWPTLNYLKATPVCSRISAVLASVHGAASQRQCSLYRSKCDSSLNGQEDIGGVKQSSKCADASGTVSTRIALLQSPPLTRPSNNWLSLGFRLSNLNVNSEGRHSRHCWLCLFIGRHEN